jgi:hypothetical protein
MDAPQAWAVVMITAQATSRNSRQRECRDCGVREDAIFKRFDVG